MSPTAEINETSAGSPVIVDLGRKKKRDIKDLCNGTGALVDEVNSCVRELRASGTISATAQAVVIVVREKRKKTLLWPGL